MSTLINEKKTQNGVTIKKNWDEIGASGTSKNQRKYVSQPPRSGLPKHFDPALPEPTDGQ